MLYSDIVSVFHSYSSGVICCIFDPDLQLDYSLTDDFCKNHFLVGLLLREVGGAMQEFRDIRQIALQVLKNLMVKHAFDDRYSSKVSEHSCVCCAVWCFATVLNTRRVCVFQGQQARLATLYLPLFSLLLENVHRLNIKDAAPVTNQTNMVRLPPSVCFRLCSRLEVLRSTDHQRDSVVTLGPNMYDFLSSEEHSRRY